MAVQTVADVVAVLGASQLLRPAQLQDVQQRLRPRHAEPKALLQALLDCGWLTAYQVRSLLLGQAARLTMGPYVILEPLGEGGMGQVFKARQQGMDRLVALKMLRQELVSDSESVSRFYREIKIASQLPDHPNLVRAYDAGPLGASHFLAMEFIEGIDLDRLVKKSGPLSVAQACDYLRQAALGLQHAHEHGLVHRDIKPSNLLVSGRVVSGEMSSAHPSPLTTHHSPTIKILDLGLARLQASEKGTARENTFLTSDGPVTLGTVDYQAPEQALDFHRADIRADIYSLGCTCHFLLTGKPPFGSGPLAIKLMRHQQAEPPKLKELRPDVPDALAALVRRMLSKRPGDRFATPGEVAERLEAIVRPAAPGGPGLLSRGAAATGRGGSRGIRWLWQQARRRPRVVLPVAAVLLVLLGVALFYSPAGRLLPTQANLEANQDALRQDLLRVRREQPGSRLARAAIDEFMKLPSPLDRLDAKNIPPDGRLPGDPKELVAVWGKPGQKRVQSVAFSPDGKILACGDSDHNIRLWDTATGQELAVLQGHPAPVMALAFSPDGKTLASGGGDVRFWDVASGKELAAQKQVWNHRPSCIAYAPDGKTFAAAYGGAGAVKLWDVAAGRERASLSGMGDLVFDLQFSADGRLVAGASYQRPVKVWNVADGAERPTVPVENTYQVAFNPDGQTMVVMPEGKLKLWDVAANRELADIPIPVRFDQLAQAPDGKKLATVTSGGMVNVWSLPAGAKLHDWRLPKGAGEQYHFTYDPAFAPDGRHLAVAGDNGKVYIFRLAAAGRVAG